MMITTYWMYVWVFKFNAKHNSVTKARHGGSIKLRARSSPMSSQFQRGEVKMNRSSRREGDYVVAVVSDNGVEMGKAVGE